MAALIVLLRFWKPRDAAEVARRPAARGSRFRAWLPWVILSVCVALWKVQPVEKWLNDIAPWKKEVPALHLAVQKMPPIAKTLDADGRGEKEPAIYKFNLPAMTGSALLVAGVLSGLLLGLRPMALARLYFRCLCRVRISLLTIALMLALGYTTRYSGTDTTMGLLLAQTGWLFPFFSPMIGWLGVALTGSDTSSNVLFGNLQKISAQQLGLSPILTAASNSSGGVMGKMIDAQSIVVASVATGGHADSPDAGTVLRSVFWHSLALALLVGVLVMAQAYLFPWMIPPLVYSR
jgi:lactate permease